MIERPRVDQHDRWTIRLGRPDRPTSPMYKVNLLEESLRRRILHRLESEGVYLPFIANFSMWLNPTLKSSFVTRCGDYEVDTATTLQRPYDHFVEVALPRTVRFGVARAVDFYHVSKLESRLRDMGFTTDL